METSVVNLSPLLAKITRCALQAQFSNRSSLEPGSSRKKVNQFVSNLDDQFRPGGYNSKVCERVGPWISERGVFRQ
jgi:hypothetical protein